MKRVDRFLNDDLDALEVGYVTRMERRTDRRGHFVAGGSLAVEDGDLSARRCDPFRGGTGHTRRPADDHCPETFDLHAHPFVCIRE